MFLLCQGKDNNRRRWHKRYHSGEDCQRLQQSKRKESDLRNVWGTSLQKIDELTFKRTLTTMDISSVFPPRPWMAEAIVAKGIACVFVRVTTYHLFLSLRDPEKQERFCQNKVKRGRYGLSYTSLTTRKSQATKQEEAQQHGRQLTCRHPDHLRHNFVWCIHDTRHCPLEQRAMVQLPIQRRCTVVRRANTSNEIRRKDSVVELTREKQHNSTLTSNMNLSLSFFWSCSIFLMILQGLGERRNRRVLSSERSRSNTLNIRITLPDSSRSGTPSSFFWTSHLASFIVTLNKVIPSWGTLGSPLTRSLLWLVAT